MNQLAPQNNDVQCTSIRICGELYKLHTYAYIYIYIYKYRKEQVPSVFTAVEVIICIVFEGNGTDKYKYPKSNKKLSLDRTS